MKLTCIILNIGYLFFAISFETVVGIPSCAKFKSKESVGSVKEYTDIAYVDIFLAITIFATTDNIFAIILIKIKLVNDVNRFFLMIFHLFLLLIL